MSDVSTTPIFPPAILPVRSGVYRTLPCDPETGEPTTDTWGLSYFDATDRVWGCGYNNFEDAWRKPDYEFASQCKQWQGLDGEAA